MPGILQRLKGIRVGVEVSVQLNRDRSILNDKWKHCVVGFKVAMATSPRTADYVAWRKEHQDLTDGRPGTKFEEEDYDATVDGAHQAVQGEASDLCEERWGKRDRRWDGTTPLSRPN